MKKVGIMFVVASLAGYSICNASMNKHYPQISTGYFDSLDQMTLHLGRAAKGRSEVLLVIVPYSTVIEELYSQVNGDVLVKEKLDDLIRNPSLVAPNISEIIEQNLLDIDSKTDNINEILDELGSIATVGLQRDVKTFFTSMLDSLSILRDACKSYVPDDVNLEDYGKIVSFYDNRIAAVEQFLSGPTF